MANAGALPLVSGGGASEAEDCFVICSQDFCFKISAFLKFLSLRISMHFIVNAGTMDDKLTNNLKESSRSIYLEVHSESIPMSGG